MLLTKTKNSSENVQYKNRLFAIQVIVLLIIAYLMKVY